MYHLEFLPDLSGLYPRPDAIFGLGSFFTYTRPDERKFIHDIDVGCYWKNGILSFSDNFEVYMEREDGNFKVLRRPSNSPELPLDVCCFNELCLNRAITNSPDSSPEARKSLYSGVLTQKYLKGKHIILEKIGDKLGQNYEEIIEERYKILQLTDFDTFKESEPYKAWKILKRLSEISKKRSIEGSDIITAELNILRDWIIENENNQSIRGKLQELQRELLELSVKHYKIDGQDLV